MLAKADRRIYIIIWCTLILCLLPAWGLFHVASTIQTDIQLDEGHLETTCTVMKFSRFEPCCTQEAVVSKMTIIPGDGFKEGEYESCVPDGYYTHCFVTADGCSATHLSPKHFDQPPCLPHSTKIGDSFECFASCQAKTFTMEPEEANYHGLMVLFFACAMTMLVVTFTGSYLVMHFSHQDYLARGGTLSTLKTPLHQHDLSEILVPTAARTSLLVTPDEELTPPNGMNDSGGSLVSFGSAAQKRNITPSVGGGSDHTPTVSSAASVTSIGGGAFDEWATASNSTPQEGENSVNSNQSSSHSSCNKRDPTMSSPRASGKRLEALRKRRVTWSLEEPEYIEPEPPDRTFPHRGLNRRRPSIDRNKAHPRLQKMRERRSFSPGRQGSSFDAAPAMTPSNTPIPPPRTPPPPIKIINVKKRRAEIPRPPKYPPDVGGGVIPDF